MKINKKLTLSLIALCLGSTSFLATAETRMDKRQERQENRVQNGVQSSQLTEKEQAHLQKRVEHTNNLETKINSDGTVTNKEKARMEKLQDRNSKAIAHQKHDKQKN